ncbi:MAG: SUMF1/EgtB/PvdO family nonheme iron enzyme [Thermoguttaceae bacterium]|jgi:formylglycine-generating enzyme required for sulfatase activity
MWYKLNRMILAAAVVLLTAGMAQAINIDMVPVSNPGFGGVDYFYKIGKCEITAGQYTAFLNDQAGFFDPYGLYDSSMATTNIGSQITKNGSVYTATLPNQPVNLVSWGDALRFCNWMQTGTTEFGAYTLASHTDWTYYSSVTRNIGATYVIPTESEWYKAAYYDPNKGGNGVGGYWLYPTKSNDAPTNVYPSTSTNNANYVKDGYTLGVTPWTTEVGSFANSLSAYGTLDQGGNVMEWMETTVPVEQYSLAVQRGGSYGDDSSILAASFRTADIPTEEGASFGFRVALVPEPGSITLLIVGLISLLGYTWRRWKQLA